MEESSRKSIFMKPMTLAEMMPNLGGILPESEMFKLTARKATKKQKTEPHTTGKDFKPCVTLTMAQLRAEIQALKPKPSPMRGRPPPSAIKRWNTSTKCENKRVSHTANASTHKLTARKILNFQPAPRPVTSNIPRPSTKPTFVTPKQIKKEKKINKMLKHLDVKNSVRISGICNIEQTPATATKHVTKDITHENKENLPKPPTIEECHSVFDESFRQLIGNKKTPVSRKSITQLNNTAKRQKLLKPATPNPAVNIGAVKAYADIMSPKTTQVNELFRHLQCKEKPRNLQTSPTYSQANSELSFLEQENVIYREDVNKVGPMMENSSIVSTPFKKYRNVEEYCNESNDFDNSNASCDVTTVETCSNMKMEASKEESEIVSLCELMHKAQFSRVSQSEQFIDNYKDELLKMKIELENERENILKSLKRNEMMLTSINKLLNLNDVQSPKKVDPCISVTKPSPVIRRQSYKPFPWKSETNTCDVPNTVYKAFIRRVSKSPSYTIPKRSPCLRKKTLCKSMPIDLNSISTLTPMPRSKSVAMNMYMKMKEQCNFLMTPVVNKNLPAGKIPNTPAITSMKLQNQLEKLYDDTP